MKSIDFIWIFISLVICSGVCIALGKNQRKKEIIQKKDMEINKFQDNFLLYNQWLMIKNEGKSLASFFQELGYNKIAIYGLGDIGNRLYEELQDSSITVEYGIDQSICNVKTTIENTYSLQEELPEVDVIVVTPFFAFTSIEKVLRRKVSCPIISIEEVVWSV